MVLETKAKWQERTWMFMCVSVQELRVWNLRLGWTLRARCSSLQWKGSIVWRTRCQGGERSWAELWVSEEHGCFKRMWCPWPVSSVGNKKKKQLSLLYVTFLGDVCIWAFCPMCHLSQPQLLSIFYSKLLCSHIRGKKHLQCVWVMVKERSRWCLPITMVSRF